MEKVNSGVVFATTIMTFLFSILARVVESTVYDFAEFTNLMISILTKNWTHTVRSKDIVHHLLKRGPALETKILTKKLEYENTEPTTGIQL